MTRLVFKNIVQSCDFCGGRNQILHPSREKHEGYFVQVLSPHHLQHVTVAELVPADVESKEACYTSKLVLGCPLD